MIKIIRRCQNSRLVESFHSLFHESVVAPLFMPFLAYMGPFLVIFWVLEVAHSGTFLPKYAHGSEKDWEKKKIYRQTKNELLPVTLVNLIFRNFAWNDDVKSFFCIVGTSWMGLVRVDWHWHMGMSYLTSLNPQLIKNIAYVGSFEHFSVQLFFTCILQLDQDQR